MSGASGPLTGVKVLEIAGVGPGPFCAMMLSDMGADVIRIERAGAPPPLIPIDPVKNLLHRGRRIVTLNLKDSENVKTLLALVEMADVLLEGYRPGVMERLGLGPDVCLERNPALVYARMTGWGQTGPLSAYAGHDINYFAVSGSLWMCGRADERPLPNLNMVADMGGGGMMMAYGIACGLLEARASGMGQVIDSSMTEGTALLGIMMHGYRAMDRWVDERGANLLDGGAHFYEVYETSDNGFMAVGAIEPQFYADLLRGLGLNAADLPKQNDRTQWPAMRERFAEIFKSRTRAEWESIFADLDACATPVLTPDEAIAHPHSMARGSFGKIAGVPQPMPAPRFSRTPGAVQAPPTDVETDVAQILRDWQEGPIAGTSQ
ncbi:CaiB/BaiF CoA-transferase family protein [Croceicoccus sp. YJ47]|uniref:CaiB/BaiF CoA transferase family protein n=1 Tax=Croceicoccus sp. YJ47 TaxID=2798724 RepID=UPI001923C088|nr:CaiB/BaiF CoA-transferase family protein [Croceicoccus sp. YJ47]QQN75320.1 CoA transferase [Croceicoccus sp. YJ47]